MDCGRDMIVVDRDFAVPDSHDGQEPRQWIAVENTAQVLDIQTSDKSVKSLASRTRLTKVDYERANPCSYEFRYQDCACLHYLRYGTCTWSRNPGDP
jgi:hypothetical protein